MKKSFRILLITLGLIAIIWFAVTLNIYSRVNPNEPSPVYSADGSKVIIPTVNNNKAVYDTYLLVHIEIQDTRSGKTLFLVQTRASDRMRWSVAWIDDNTVRLDSSDIGLYCWKEAGGIWGETKCP